MPYPYEELVHEEYYAFKLLKQTWLFLLLLFCCFLWGFGGGGGGGGDATAFELSSPSKKTGGT